MMIRSTLLLLVAALFTASVVDARLVGSTTKVEERKLTSYQEWLNSYKANYNGNNAYTGQNNNNNNDNNEYDVNYNANGYQGNGNDDGGNNYQGGDDQVNGYGAGDDYYAADDDKAAGDDQAGYYNNNNYAQGGDDQAAVDDYWARGDDQEYNNNNNAQGDDQANNNAQDNQGGNDDQAAYAGDDFDAQSDAYDGDGVNYNTDDATGNNTFDTADLFEEVEMYKALAVLFAALSTIMCLYICFLKHCQACRTCFEPSEKQLLLENGTIDGTGKPRSTTSFELACPTQSKPVLM